jgi:Bacterial Ig-like domain (group 3)/SdrD B-like domain/Domain of unknown function (DUF4214)
MLYQLPAADFHQISQLDDGTATEPGYNLHTGLGSPVANLLVADLIGGVLNADNQLVGGKTTISGTVFDDLNLNGQFAPNDPGLAGWTVTLGSIQPGQFVPGTSAAASTTTNASGGFSFVVAPGQYAVQVTAPNGYVATTSTLRGFDIAPGSTVASVTTNFGYAAGPVSPLLTLISSATFAQAGAHVTLAATISAVSINGSMTIPTGTVSFFDGSTLLATVKLSDNSVAYSTDSLAIGTHSISAQFNPSSSSSADFRASLSSATSVQIVPSPAPTPCQRDAKFVTTLYRDVLGRVPKPSGLNFWVSRLLAGASPCRVALRIWNSVEHRSLIQRHLAPRIRFRSALAIALQESRTVAAVKTLVPALAPKCVYTIKQAASRYEPIHFGQGTRLAGRSAVQFRRQRGV